MSSRQHLKGLVLAGGKGTRLRPLTFTTAKQLVPVANKPILYYAVDSLYQAGITEIGVIISPETGDAVQKALAEWNQPEVTFTYIPQDAPLGLAHAVKIAEPFLKDSAFVMYLGDNLIQSGLRDMVTAFQSGTADANILLKAVPNPQSFGVAQLDTQGQVMCLDEKPVEPKSNLALVGVYLFTPHIFEAIRQIKPSARGELEITDAIQHLITSRQNVEAHLLEGWWLDTGKKDDLLEANRMVLEAYCQAQCDGHVDAASQIQGAVEIGSGTQIINSKIQGPVCIGQNCRIENTFIGPYTSIGEGSHLLDVKIEDSVILKNCSLSHLAGRIEQSLLGHDCTIGKTEGEPATYRLLLGDQSVLEVS